MEDAGNDLVKCWGRSRPPPATSDRRLCINFYTQGTKIKCAKINENYEIK